MYLILQVLVVEQMLTTAGGWQDQVGGGFPGLKLCRGLPSLSPSFDMEQVMLSNECLRIFHERTVLIFSGKTRAVFAAMADKGGGDVG